MDLQNYHEWIAERQRLLERIKELEAENAEFDNILGWCLGQNKWCDYIEGNFSFICVVAGFNAAELTPKYPDFIKERVYALYDAVYWWNEYGSECLKSNEKP